MNEQDAAELERLLSELDRAIASDPQAARQLLQRCIAQNPDDADAQHALGRVCEALGDHEAAARHFVHTRRLDTQADAAAAFDAAAASQHIVGVAREVVEGLPEHFRQRLAEVPIVVEPRPASYLVEQGFDPRCLGLFEGLPHGEHVWEASRLPPRIVLYSANLTASLDPDDSDALRREVEITVLHEIGHYFGLEEARLHELGLG